jgi:hypothetical protein
MLPFMAFGLVTMVLLVPVGIFAECGCTGQSSNYIYQGGDGKPLRWFSLQRTEVAGDPPIYCYERTVKNESSQDITDVYWPVAGYQRKILPANPPDCCCQYTPVPGALKTPHPTGSLHYGAGTSHYPTTTYAPERGWSTTVAMRSLAASGLKPADYPPLTSGIELALRNPQGQIVMSRVKLTSIVEPSANRNTYLYMMENKGPEPLFIFWDIPLTMEARREIGLDIKEPLRLPPDDSTSHSISSSEPPAWALTTVVIFNGKHELVARALATVYGFAKGELLKDSSLDWEIPRRPLDLPLGAPRR